MGNQRDQVFPFRFINRADEVYHLFRGKKLLRGMKYIIKLDKQVVESVRTWIEENWYLKRVN